jgi:uncharacterized protein (TIGR03032 family)
MARLRDSGRLSLSTAALSGNPTRLLQPETVSEPRENRTFAGLALQERLEREGVGARCGLAVVDLQSGDAVHWLRIEGVVRELYDVAVILGRRRPSLIGFKSDEIRRVISFDASGETNG